MHLRPKILNVILNRDLGSLFNDAPWSFHLQCYEGVSQHQDRTCVGLPGSVVDL